MGAEYTINLWCETCSAWAGAIEPKITMESMPAAPLGVTVAVAADPGVSVTRLLVVAMQAHGRTPEHRAKGGRS